jgi:NADPH-dependent 2,4-dienoyl-CoA reductase/sulfur reductase-like enzyme/ferredoxin
MNAFPSFLEMEPRVPRPAWDGLRALVLAAAVALCVVLVVDPHESLRVFWRWTVPLLPAVFFLAPGLWRNVCPLATSNQLPRRLGLTRAAAAPALLQRYGYLVAVAGLLVLVPLRKPLFERSGVATAVLVACALAGAFAGGVLLRGKSGWCSSLCPLLPVQRLYGQTPFAVVRNSHCAPCLGCSVNCYDFNPRVAQVADLADDERAPSRKLFAGAFPGLVVAFFTTAPSSSAGEFYVRTAVAVLVGAGAIYAADALLHPPPALLTAFGGAAALNLFYWYLLPKLGVPGWAAWPQRALLAALTAVWLVRTFRTGRAVEAEEESRTGAVRVDAHAAAVFTRDDGLAEVTVGERHLAVPPGTTLLEVAERLELPVEPGCRMGVCGADPVCVLDGAANLSPIGSAEQATLQRLGLSEEVRMACCARVSGPVELTLDTRRGAAQASAVGDPSIERVVIVGNGIAGVTAAEHVRRGHGSCEIHLIGRERHNLYNRMAITRLIYGRTGMQGLYLLPDSWYEENRITTWLNTQATSLDLERRQLELATGEELEYDRLILTAGSSNFVPTIAGWGARGTFVLRTAQDAMEIREHLQARRSRAACVAGGGLLGLEAAYALVKYGARVTVVQRGDRLLPRQLDARGGAYLRSYLEGFGMVFAMDTEAATVEGEPLERVVLADGREVACDLLLACAGIVPNLDLAADAGLDVHRGVVVDDGMRASDPNVFAAGDVAEHDGVVWGLWPIATEQGRIAAVNALGGEEGFVAVPPLTMLKVSGVDLTSVGAIEGEPGDEEIALEDPDESRYRKLVVRDGRLVGAILLGYARESAAVAAAVQEGWDVGDRLERLREGDWSVLEPEGAAVA